MLDLSLTILGIMAPSVLLAMIGLAWHRSGVDYPREFVTRLVINIALPALIFFNLATADVDPASLWDIGLATLVIHLIFVPVAIAILHLGGMDRRLSVTFSVGNTGNLGLPLCLLAFGDTGLTFAIAFFAVQSILLFTIGEAIYAGSMDWRQALRSPVIFAIAAALLVRALDVPLHSIVLDTTRILGQLVVPLMLITLGVSIAGMKAVRLSNSLMWAGVRTLLAAAIGFGVAELFGFEGVMRGVIVLETVVPVAVFHYLLAHRHGMDDTDISSLILITHIAALFYLPVVLGFLL